MQTLIVDNSYILNASIDLQDSIQSRGLDPDARNPHDYLKMVSKTFSAFKETSIDSNTISYIHGFSVDYLLVDSNNAMQYLTIEDVTKYVTLNKIYHIFRINPGACFIDDQFVEFKKPVLFLFEAPTDNSDSINSVQDLTNPNFDGQEIKLFKNLDYKIIVEYSWLQQFPAQRARIKIIANEALYNYDTENIPYFEIATFTTDDNGNIIRSTPEVYNNINSNDLKALIDGGELVSIINSDNTISYYKRGVNPQQLSKKYMDNFKSLFSNIQDQMFSVFNSAGLSKSIYTTVNNLDVQIGLKSGTMVYFDQRDKLYKPAMSSRQKTDKVNGLYLYDNINDTHLVFFSGLIDLDPDNVLLDMQYQKLVKEVQADGSVKIYTFTNRYGLTYNHPLVNLEVGNSYYLEDDSNYFNGSILMYDLANYVEWDTRGFISTRFFPGAVSVGNAVSRTKLLLNINHSNEIDWSNAVDLYGNHKLFSDEYLAVNSYYSNDLRANTMLASTTTFANTVTNYSNYLGTILDFSELPNISLDSNGVAYSIDYANNVTPDFINFSMWFSNYLIETITFPTGSSLYLNDIPALSFNEPDTNSMVQFFNNTFCVASGSTAGSTASNNLKTMVLNSVKTVYGQNAIISNIITNNNRVINILLIAINGIENDLLTLDAGNIQSDLDKLVTITQLALGDDPDDTNNILEDITTNLIANLGIMYTDENNKTINYSVNPRVETAAEISARQSKADSLTNELIANSSSLEALNLANSYYTNLLTALQIFNYKLSNMLKYTENIISFVKQKIIDLNKTISDNKTLIAAYQNSKALADTQRAQNNETLALDIFYLSNYERKRFNYTYLVDRLTYEFSLSNQLQSEFTSATGRYNALLAGGSNSYDTELARLDIVRIETRINNNQKNIINYTDEINNILMDFNKTPIVLNDKNFTIDTILLNTDANNYRFGVDLGPLGTNNERYLINEAFKEVTRLKILDLSNNIITRDQFPNRLVPAVYQIDGSSLQAPDFETNAFKTLTFLNGYKVDTSNPYFYIMLDNVQVICYEYDGEYFIYDSIGSKPAGDTVTFPDIDFNNITPFSAISNVHGDIVAINGSKNLIYRTNEAVTTNVTIPIIGDNFYVYKDDLKSFVSLVPVDLNTEELTRFVREARVKSVSEDFNYMVSYVSFVDYFLKKEEILTITSNLDSYIASLDSIVITDYSSEINIVLPVIDTNYTDLITNCATLYTSFIKNRDNLNIVINIMNNTSDKTNLTNLDITDSELITYGLTSSFRTSNIETRSHLLTQVLDNFRLMLFNDISAIKLNIANYRDTNILNILSINSEFNA